MSAPHGPEGPYPEWFGHDKVSIFGVGGMPAAPPAPPGSTARRQGDVAVADALAKVGQPGTRPGAKPAMRVPRPAMKRAMRMQAERALMAASMKRLAEREGDPAPSAHVSVAWRMALGPAYRLLPWGVKRRVVGVTSGVRGWRSGKR